MQRNKATDVKLTKAEYCSISVIFLKVQSTKRSNFRQFPPFLFRFCVSAFEFLASKHPECNSSLDHKIKTDQLVLHLQAVRLLRHLERQEFQHYTIF